MLDCELIEVYEKVARQMSRLLEKQKGNKANKTQCVFSGCGTSGRIAFLTARRYNMFWQHFNGSVEQKPFNYLMAGGDAALLLSDEMPEDDPHLGAKQVEDIHKTSGVNGTYLIGVTCGISAPYVAGQLDYFLNFKSKNGDQSGAAVLGFNPYYLSRNQAIEKFEDGRSFRDIAVRLYRESKKIVAKGSFGFINPVIGPEPVSGSSRMKGGSATTVLLDAICMRALGLVPGLFSGPHSPYCRTFQKPIEETLLEYQACHYRTYKAMLTSLGPTLDDAAGSLKAKDGHMYYVGSGAAGIAGFIDASEMPDTYGSPFDQIRGFVEEGWDKNFMGNKEGDISSKSHLLQLSLEDFNKHVLPNLSKDDTVVVLISAENYENKVKISPALEAMTVAASLVSKVSILSVLPSEDNLVLEKVREMVQKCNKNVRQTIVTLPNAHDGLFSYALKLMLNAISTYAQAKGRGALFRGLMVSAGPANDKIYMRCVDIISETTKVTKREAEICLIKAIHRKDSIDEEKCLNQPRSVHIKASILPEEQRDRAQISLPIALLVATGKWNVSSAVEALRREPRVSVHLTNTALDRNIPPPAVEDNGKYIIGIDLGGTWVRALAINPATYEPLCEVVSENIKESTKNRAFEEIVNLIVKACLKVIKKIGPKHLVCVGIGQPGHVSEDGSISKLANFDWGDEILPLKKMLLERLPQCNKVHVLDDANAALIAESQFYPNRSGSLCMVTIGTGVGTSLLLGSSTVYTGLRGLVEGGHMIVVPDGKLCSCGQRGCLEMYCSGTAIAAASCPPCTAEEVVAKASNGDNPSQAILESAAKHLAIGCINIVRLYDPEIIIFGGGVAPVLFESVQQWYHKLSWHLHDDIQNEKKNNDGVRFQLAKCKVPGCVGAAMAAGFLYA